MHKGTRVALIAGGLIVLSYPASAWLIGLVVENHLQQQEQHALEQAPALTLLHRDYQRGIYSATEELTYEVRGPFARVLGVTRVADPPPGLQFKVRNSIHHGPLPQLRTAALATVDSEVAVPAALRTALEPSLGAQPLLTAHSRLGWRGGSFVVMQSPPFAMPLPHGGLLRWRGIHVSASATRDQRAWMVDATAPGLSLKSDKVTLSSEDMRLHAVMHRWLTELDVGTARASLARLDIETAPDGGSASMQQLSVDSASTMNGDFVDSKTSLAIASLRASDFSASNLGYSLTLTHMQAQALDTLTRELRAAARDLYAVGSGNPAQQRLVEVFRRDGVELLLHDPLIEISRLGFSTHDGQFTLSMRMRAPGLRREDFEGAAPSTIAALIHHLDLLCDAKVDSALLEQLLSKSGKREGMASQLAALEAQGLLERDGSALTAHMVFSDGNLTVNGHAYPPRR